MHRVVPLALVLLVACTASSDGDGFQRFIVVGDETGRGVLEADADRGTLCYEATFSGVRAAHLLRAAGGTDRSSPVVTFFEPPDAPDRSDPCIGDIDASLLRDLIEDPDPYTIDLHRSEHGAPIELRLQPQESGL